MVKWWLHPAAVFIVSAAACGAALSAMLPFAAGDDDNRAATVATAQTDAAAASEIEFNRDIRPILSDKCFQCHGPDSAAREAGLRLDLEDAAKGELPTGHRAIVAGDIGSSALIARITSTDDSFRMPPADSGKTLSQREIALLTRWIEEGAHWQPHWSYIAPNRPELPAVRDADWPRNAIDHFILARLEREGLAPSREASKETLIRRVTFDLTGLPPTPEEIDAFLADDSPDAYETVVDRLLASPRYGEHMARYWLDAARYGDTHGLHLDNRREIWRWRDWVVNAFNSNMPFDQFTIEQLAGDLLEEPTLEQRIATGFNRNNVTTSEGGAIDAEYLVKYAVDRAETTATVWMGLTAGCAACHDHKYDPLTQREFYELFAFFSNVAENAMDGNAADPPPILRAPNEAQQRELDAMRAHLAALEAEVEAPAPEIDSAQAQWEQDVRERAADRWKPLELRSFTSSGGATLRALEDGSVVAEGENPPRDTYEIVAHTHATNLRFIRLDALLHETLPFNGPGRAPNANFVLSEIEVEAAPLNDPDAAAQPLRFIRAIADHSQANNEYWIEKATDGVIDDVNGWAVEGYERREPRLAVFMTEEPFGFDCGTELRIRLRFETGFGQHAIGRFKLAVGDDAALVEDLAPLEQSPWRLAGPFPAASFDAAFDAVAGPEVEPGSFDAAATFAEGAIAWQERSDFGDGAVRNLPPADNAAHYLHRTITVASAGRVALSLGSDDGVKLWHNGALVLERKVLRPAAADQERIEIELQPGENHILMKIVNAAGGFAFYWQPMQPREGPESFYITELFASATEDLSEEQRAAVRRFFRRNHSPQMRALYDSLGAARAEEAAFVATLPVTMVMAERMDDPRSAYVLNRGNYDDPLDAVTPATPVFLPAALGRDRDNESDAAAQPTRLDLARWLVSPEHPLTARVTANRLWQQVFATGIVRTSEDFGSQGEQPTHPGLLDWLAVEFRESGWDMKHIMRLMVTSASYRQSSRVGEELLARDPENRLLARGPRFRLDAEMIRDQALHVSGLLVEEMGGPGVNPYQPPGLWEAVGYPTSDTSKYTPDSGDDLYRRSLYTFWKRTSPPPNMLTFDAPMRESCVTRRPRTNTPLQVLVLWNDTQFIEAARALAERMMREAGRDELDKIALGFRLATARAPDAEESRILHELFLLNRMRYEEDRDAAAALINLGESEPDASLDAARLAAWTTVASAILSLDETITRN